MKLVELLVIIHCVFLIGFGVLAALFASRTLGIVTMVAGVVVFLCAVIFRRQIWKWLWAPQKPPGGISN